MQLTDEQKAAAAQIDEESNELAEAIITLMGNKNSAVVFHTMLRCICEVAGTVAVSKDSIPQIADDVSAAIKEISPKYYDIRGRYDTDKAVRDTGSDDVLSGSGSEAADRPERSRQGGSGDVPAS